MLEGGGERGMLQEEINPTMQEKSRGGVNKCINKRKGRYAKCSLVKDSSQIVDASFFRHTLDGNILMFINARQATQQKPGLALGKLKSLH